MAIYDEIRLRLLRVLGASAQIEQLEQAVAGRELEISQLTQTMSKLESELDRSEMKVRQLSEDQTSMKVRCDQLMASIDDLNKSLLEKERVVEDISAALERQRRQDKILSDQRVQARLEDLFRGLAGPVCQMATLLHRAKAGAEIAVSDLAAVGQSIVSALAEGGLRIDGKIDETTVYREDIHEGLDESFSAGDHVCVKMPSVHFREQVLRKAIVIRAVGPSEPGAVGDSVEPSPLVHEGGG